MPPKRGFAELSEDLQAQQKRQRRQQPAAVCPRMKTCLDFLTEFLNLPAGYLDSNYDRCYCKVCAERDRIPDVLELDRADGYKYEVPKDWCGFGLKLPPRYASCRTESSGCLGALFEPVCVSNEPCPSFWLSGITIDHQCKFLFSPS